MIFDKCGPYDRVIGMPRFSADGARVAFAVRRDDRKQAVIADGVQGPAFDQIDTLAFSPKSNRLLFRETVHAGSAKASLYKRLKLIRRR